MKVLVTTLQYPPISRVGAWIATHRFAAALVEDGHEVVAFSMRERHRPYVHDGVVVQSALRGPSTIDRLVAGCDVVVSHAGDGGFGMRVARRAGKLAVVMVHGAGSQTLPDADLLVFNSRHLQANSPHNVPSIVCHPPVDPAAHRVDETGGAVTIVNLSKAKGVKVAWALAERFEDRDFLGVKGGYGHQDIPRAKNFRTIPTQQDMRDVWSQTRVLLMPSEFETWGMVGVEAMASGIPVIASDVAGTRESLADAGLFAPVGDVDAFAHHLQSLDDPAVYRERSDMARRRVAELDPRASTDTFAAALSHMLVAA